ncbi:MAG: cytochrome C oxidase Cbb3 [Calditrichaeota bacterium]|nr:MAG: cytochrome C oxidase Cbb3 [Calditrichota bacterium]
MFKHIFESIGGIHVYPLIALFLFFGFFVALIFWVLKLDKRFLKKMEHLPLDSSNSNFNTGDQHDE